MEKFISFEVNYLQFIDTAQFVKASLDCLVNNLVNACTINFDKFVHTRRHLGDNKLVFSKSVYPYEWFDNMDKFKETCLPPIESFHSRLKDQGISDEDYEHAQKVWSTFNCSNMKDSRPLFTDGCSSSS